MGKRMGKRRKSSKKGTAMAKNVVIVPSSAEKGMTLKNPTYKKQRNNENNEDPEDHQSPLRSIFCLKKIVDMKRVACRDYPHSRHLCLQFPFDTTPHDRHCHLCYCYVCDSAAPCEFWVLHCDASEHVETWKSQRQVRIPKGQPSRF
ncbi:hypothetical protein Gotri_017521 [Gossypium trilobum]|uniref:Uncharacterized protein n=1 Tax=Gossypium trilobum TaxID=34281 RepID=A0A7J9E732_9ROSI|nr:hypothetical protein [Gossypium trilobum]